MSSEEQPTTPTPTPEQAGPITPDSERVGNQEKAKNPETQDGRDAGHYFSSENKSLYERFSEGAKKIVNQVYEGLYRIPGVRRVVGKLEIAYNQFWIDRHQAKAIQHREEIDRIGLSIAECEASRKRTEAAIEYLESQNLPVESLQIELQKTGRESTRFQNKQDQAQSSFEERYNMLRLYTSERDRVASRFIERYEEKLRPMEAELESLSTCRDETDLRVAVTEFRHKKKLTELEERKARIEECLRQTNRFSEEKIRKNPAIRKMNKMLADARKEIRVERETLARRKAEIDRRIAKVDAKANPYRDKREEFVRVIEGRPIKIDVAARQKGEEFKGKEETQAHPRREGKSEEKTREHSRRKGESEEETRAHSRRESESKGESTEDKEQLQVADFIGGWNKFLKETYKDAAELIDAKDFLKATCLSGDEKLDFKDFKNFLGKYLKYRKLPVGRFSQSIDKFFEQKVKVGK